jgi:arginine deiminase
VSQIILDQSEQSQWTLERPGQNQYGQNQYGQSYISPADPAGRTNPANPAGTGASAGADSEFGRLRTVLMHRPGLELKRITPRTRHLLQVDGLPWPARAQQEHDALAELLRTRGTEVIYLTQLLQDVLGYQAARDESIAAVLASSELGDELTSAVGGHLRSLRPEDLASALIAGLTTDELRAGRGLVYDLLTPHDFILEPLPNLVFSRDAGAWLGDQLVLGTLPGPRRREADLLAVIYAHHPRFASPPPGTPTPASPPPTSPLPGTPTPGRPAKLPYRVGGTRLDGGDLLLLGPGVVAVGVGARSTPAAAELLAKYLLDTGTAHTVLAVPMTQPDQAGRHLDTACTVLDHGVVLMVPALAFTLTALTITSRDPGLRVSRPQPFLEAAARALGIDRLTVIETGVDSMYGVRGQWEDGANTLAIGGGVLLCDERNAETNARLAAAGYDVIAVSCGELGGVRGGPRCQCVPIVRDPARAQANTAPLLHSADRLTDRPRTRAELAPLRG